MGYDPDGTWNWGVFATIFTGAVYFTALIVGVALAATGVGAPIGAILIGAGAGGLVGIGGSIVSQGFENGWNNINWGQVAFNGFTGAIIGGLMASPLGPLAAGIAIGVTGFVESVGNDLFENNGDWGSVRWGKAFITGIAMGVLSGVGKLFVNFGNSINFNIDKFTQASIPAARSAALIGKTIARGAKLITSGGRFITKLITQLLKW